MSRCRTFAFTTRHHLVGPNRAACGHCPSSMATQQYDNRFDERPTESTPLISRRSSTVHSQLSPSPLPSLTPAVNHIRLHGIQTVDDGPTPFSFAHSASLAQQTSFKIIVLSQLYILAKAPPIGVDTDVWEQWSRERRPSLDADDLQRRIVGVWEEFTEVSRSTQEIEECLWTPFALEEGKPLTVRGTFPICCARRSAFHSPVFVLRLSRRYCEGSGCASRPPVSSSDFPELVSHLDSWNSRHPCRVFIPSYLTTLPLSGNPKVC